MTQHNLTQILKVIRDLVMRNRPCYRDYLGTETVTTTMQIGSRTFEADGTYAYAEIPIENASFSGFVLGETYTVTIDGAAEDFVARNFSPISESWGPIIGTATTYDTENDTYDGWVVYADHTDPLCVAETCDTSFIGKTISISQTKTETVKRYKTKLLPEYLLPAFLRKNVVASKTEVQSAVAATKKAIDDAHSAASAAYIAANTAQTTANAAQTTANAAQTTANEVSLKTANPAKGVFFDTDNGTVSGQNSAVIYAGDNGVLDGKKISGIRFLTFAPNVGDIYSNLLMYVTPPTGKGAATLHFTGGASYGSNKSITTELADISAIVLKSSTTGSTKQFRLTVDDTGTLTATEVTS